MDTLDHLPLAIRAAAPDLTADAADMWAAALTAPMRACWIVSARRIAAALGTFAVESGGFTQLIEDGYYSAERICAVWPSRFATVAAAAPYANNPEKLLSRVYADRMGNGDEASGDGFLCRGRGLIQITGRAAIENVAKAFKRSFADTLAWLETPTGAAFSACHFWSQRSSNPALNVLADQWDIGEITRLVNGGDTDLESRLERCTAVLKYFDTD